MPDWVPARCREIGERIRILRKGQGISQLVLGERVGRDHKTIHRYEAGHTVPTLVDLLLIAHALNVPLHELVRPADETGA